MSWNFGDIQNLFLNLKSNLEPHHVLLTPSNLSIEKPTITIIEMRQPEIEKPGSKEKIFSPKMDIMEW